MKRIGLAFLLCSVVFSLKSQNWKITEKKAMPVRVANNSVAEAVVNGKTYIYSFGGIDSTKLYSGINNKCYKYDVANDSWDTIPDLPDTNTKIAAGASYVNGIIYIIGGYTVRANGTEFSSNKIHRFDPTADTFLTDGTIIPRVIDDHVQAVYKDSLIYVVTGWSNSRNVNFVQIYDTYLNSWSTGTRVPGSTYQAFGASGTIVGDTLYYFGGALNGASFPISNHLRKGYIDPANPTTVSWQQSIPDTNLNAYRAACISIDSTIYWIGGSNITYNFDGIAYNGSGGVSPANQIRSYSPSTDSLASYQPNNDTLPMDLRGWARISDSVFYIVGGMEHMQEVSNKTYRLEYNFTTGIEERNPEKLAKLYPNPFRDRIRIVSKNSKPIRLEVYNAMGVLIHRTNDHIGELNTSLWKAGVYYIHLWNKENHNIEKVIRMN